MKLMLSGMVIAIGWVAGFGFGWSAMGALQKSNPSVARVAWWTLAGIYGFFAAVILYALAYAIADVFGVEHWLALGF